MNITYIKQDRKRNCGQTVVAMLTGMDVRKVEKLYGGRSGTFIGQQKELLAKLGYKVSEVQAVGPNEDVKLPAVAYVRVGYLKRSGGNLSTTGKVRKNGHAVLFANGKFYDPFYGVLDNVAPGTRVTHFVGVEKP